MDIMQILELEASNQEWIYLHNEEKCWYAYEFSAFCLNSAFQVDCIERFVDDVCKVRVVRIPVKDPGIFFTKNELQQCGENMIKVKCRFKYSGFNMWKSCFIY